MSDEQLSAADIPWASDSVPRLELLPASDLIALDPGDLLEYAYDLQRDLLAVRELLHAAVSVNARVTAQRDRAIDQLRRRTRTERPQ